MPPRHEHASAEQRDAEERHERDTDIGRLLDVVAEREARDGAADHERQLLPVAACRLRDPGVRALELLGRVAHDDGVLGLELLNLLVALLGFLLRLPEFALKIADLALVALADRLLDRHHVFFGCHG